MVLLVVVMAGMTTYAIVDSRNMLRQVNESIKEMDTELDKVSVKYAYVNPKPVNNVALNKSQLRELYRLQVVAMEYEEMAEQDTMTLEQKVDVLSIVLTNIIRFNFIGYNEVEFIPDPSWDKWFSQIKKGTDSGITKAIE